MNNHKFPYKWTLKDACFTKDKGKVFSCFACGGGSTMGYKLAGYDVIGCNEIDPRMNAVYVANHHPKYNFLCDIKELVKRDDLPAELYQLDILDGSPPCSSFSIAGSREDTWGKMKKFQEGQKEQILDELFFDFIALAKRLQPKVVIAENVKGLLLGEAIDYVRRIYEDFDQAGYYCQHWLLNAKDMGVPQRRERVFFVCLRKDVAGPLLKTVSLFEELPELNLEFNEPPIFFGEFADYQGREITGEKLRYYWENRIHEDDGMGDTTIRILGKEKCFNHRYDKEDEVCHTLTAKDAVFCYSQPKAHSKSDVINISTFPQDYDFLGQKPCYVCGMSVPPIMMAQVASRIYEQWLSKL
jgi:DNA (cytosine-5)-methyltransferase 1